MFQKINLAKESDNLKRKNLVKFKVDLGLKSKDMAKRLGITNTKYSNIENGRVDPSIELLFKFREEFDADDVLELFKLV